MNIRHLAIKSFGKETGIRDTVLYNGMPFLVSLDQNNTSKQEEVILSFSPQYPSEMNMIKSLSDGKKALIDNELNSIFMKNNDVLPLSSLYDYKVTASSEFKDILPVGTTFSDIINDSIMQDKLCDIAKIMYPNENPDGTEQDIDINAFYTPYIPLTSLTGVLPPQQIDNKAYFNPDGVVTVAEFLDGLNAIKYGANANNNRKKTLDMVSDESDFFNEGYQACLRGLSSPFFNLYTKDELLKPITRVELAYITVVCWERFIQKYDSLYGNNYYLGINFDWEHPSDALSIFKDGFKYKISKINTSDEYDTISLNIRDYMSDRSMTEYKDDIKDGKAALPLPMFMTLVELKYADMFYFGEGGSEELLPLREVTRGELAYFLTKVAENFPTKYLG